MSIAIMQVGHLQVILRLFKVITIRGSLLCPFNSTPGYQ